MGQKGTGRRLSDQERIEIIAKLEGDKPRASAAECARQYGVSSAAITKLMKMKDKVKQRFQEHNAFSQQRKRGGTERHAAFEDELFQWISAQQQQQQQQQLQTLEAAAAGADAPASDAASNISPLTSAKVQEKAQELLKIHDLGSFRASKGWYYRFCRRYGLSRSSLAGDDADADDDADHALDHSGGEDSDGAFAVGDHHSVDGGEVAAGQDAAPARAKNKRKESGAPTATGWRKKTKTSATATQGWAVQALQDTLAKAALALDHPQAREYLGEPAACEMLRSIQQSIGVVQCIQLKKAATPASSEASASATVEVQDESSADTLDAAVPLVQESPDAATAEDAVVPDAGAGALDDVIV